MQPSTSESVRAVELPELPPGTPAPQPPPREPPIERPPVDPPPAPQRDPPQANGVTGWAVIRNAVITARRDF